MPRIARLAAADRDRRTPGSELLRSLARRGNGTFALLCLVSMVDQAEVMLLPSVYLEVCQEFHVGTGILGLTTMWRGVVQSLVAVAAGPLSGRFNRIHLIAFGVTLWAVASALVGSAQTQSELMLARTFNGVGIGLTLPIVYGLCADSVSEAARGRAFGTINFAGNLGGALGAFFATTLAGARPVPVRVVPSPAGASPSMGSHCCRVHWLCSWSRSVAIHAGCAGSKQVRVARSTRTRLLLASPPSADLSRCALPPLRHTPCCVCPRSR